MTSMATGLAAGTHDVTVTDANGCMDMTSITVSEPAVLTSTGSTTAITCYGGSDGTASVSNTGGTTMYSWMWSNGGTGSTVTGLMSGVYDVTTTDANGCMDIAGVTLAAASTLEKELRDTLKNGGNKDAATAVGKLIAERAKKAGVTTVAFDRGAFKYHGRVKALAEAAREGGLSF